MNKYHDKSDFEINKAVAEITIYGDWYLSPTDEQPFTFFNYGINSSKTVELPDYCNNPADAMPIVIENKITVAYDKLYETWCAHVGSVMSGDGGWDYSIEPVINYCDDNYYRAAMICFLMMKDAENEKV